MKVIKAGFNDYTKPVKIRKGKNLTVKVKKAQTQIFVESIPSRAKVYIDSKYLGRTPISKPLKVDSGFIKLEILGPTGYKKHSQILDISEDDLDFTDIRSIKLYKNRLNEANIAFKNKKFNKYLSTLGSIKKDHPDYLEAQHLIGEMLLFKLDRPKDALVAFNQVTSSNEVKKFINKKYLKTHILEGVAYYNIFSGQKNINEYSSTILQKSIDKMNQVKPYLRHLSSQEYAYLSDTVYYYKALSFQKLYKISNDKRFISFALSAWGEYFNNTDKSTSSYYQKATIYNKQMLAIRKTKGNKKI